MEASDFSEKEREQNQSEFGHQEEEEKPERNREDPVGVGLSSIISSLLRDHDSASQLTLASQTHLSLALHRLTRELDQLLEDAPLPFAVQYGGKVSSVRKRVLSLNSLLKSIQQRLDNVDRMLSLNSAHRQV